MIGIQRLQCHNGGVVDKPPSYPETQNGTDTRGHDVHYRRCHSGQPRCKEEDGGRKKRKGQRSHSCEPTNTINKEGTIRPSRYTLKIRWDISSEMGEAITPVDD